MLTPEENIVPTSQQTGMGSIVFPGGVAFRVWAPFANSVAVAGQFNNWSQTANLLTPEGTSGYWSTDVPGAAVGQQYRYVITNGSNTLWKIDPYCRAVTNSAGNSIVYADTFDWGGSVFQMPAWNEMVICEIHIGTFNDPFPITPPQPGTFATATTQLPYLRDLGVNAVCVMPIHEFQGDLSWGYDPDDIFAVESSYGGPDAFKAFVQAAHANGIAVLLDVVYNHFGAIQDADYLWCLQSFDGWAGNAGGGIYFYEDSRSNTPWGFRPDYGRPEVRQFIRDNVLMWLSHYQVDGLRFDSTVNIRNIYGNNNDPANDIPDGWGLMQWLNSEIVSNLGQPWKITIAEDLQDNAWITLNTGSGGAGFGSQWDNSFCWPVRDALIVADDDQRNTAAVAASISQCYGGDAFARVIYTESHDVARQGQSRLPIAIWPGDPGNYFSKKRSTLGAVIALTSPGIPMLLQGQEFLADGYFDDNNPINWGELQTYGGIHDLYRDVIQLRRNWFNNTRGLSGSNVNVYQAGPDDKVIAYHRWNQGGPGDDVIVVINMRNVGYDSYTIGLPQQGTWHVRFNSDYNGYSSDFGNWTSYDTTASGGPVQNMPYSGNIGIGPYSSIILSQ